MLIPFAPIMHTIRTLLFGLIFVFFIENEVLAEALPSSIFDRLGKKLENGGIPSAFTAYKVKIGAKKFLTLKIELTSKGNGVVRIGNLDVFLYKDNLDEFYYEGSLLKTEFIDLHGTGYKDVVISGTELKTDEKTDKIVKRKSVCCILAFDPKTNTFKVAYKASNKPLIFEVKSGAHHDALRPGLEDEYTKGPAWSSK